MIFYYSYRNGCDKSGLYCVLATVIERLRIEQDVDIQHIIKQMRNRRPQIIPNYVNIFYVTSKLNIYLEYSNFAFNVISNPLLKRNVELYSEIIEKVVRKC